MALYFRVGAGFRWTLTTMPGQPGDVMRVLDHEGLKLAVLANGYECGFSTCWPPASRLILDLFLQEWAASSGTVRQRLFGAFAAARGRFLAQAPSLITPNADFPDDHPDATLLAAVIEGATTHVAWIGGDVGLLARGFRAIRSTTPHTLPERVKHQHPEVRDLSGVPDVLVRSIAERTDSTAPDYLSVDMEAGDTLLLLSRSALRSPCITVDDAAFAAAGHASPAALAELLAETAFVETDAPYAAVVALRCDNVDLGTTIDRLIDAYEPDPRHGAWVREWSQRERALPVVFDMGGILGMRRDGTVVSVPWDEPAKITRAETTGVTNLAAVIGAGLKYRELTKLVPSRPSDSLECGQCTELNPDGGRGCPLCWYLGWLPPPAPSWFFGVPQRITVAASATKRPWWRRLIGRAQ